MRRRRNRFILKHAKYPCCDHIDQFPTMHNSEETCFDFWPILKFGVSLNILLSGEGSACKKFDETSWPPRFFDLAASNLNASGTPLAALHLVAYSDGPTINTQTVSNSSVLVSPCKRINLVSDFLDNYQKERKSSKMIQEENTTNSKMFEKHPKGDSDHIVNRIKTGT